MSSVLDAEIEGLLVRAEPAVAGIAAEVIALVRRLRPDLEPKVRLGWGSVNFRHKATGFVCAVFPMRDHVSLVFEHGRQLDSALLQGEGKQVRYVPFRPGDELPENELGLLLAEAIALKS